MTRVVSKQVGRIYDRHHRVEPCDIGKSCSGLIAEGECGSHRQWFGDPSTLYEQVVEPSLRCQAANLAIIDVREEEDYLEGHIPGAINLPHDRWQTLQGLRKDTLNVIYCYSHVCHLAATAAVEFAGKGYSVMEMDGGFKAWKENDLEIEQSAPRRQRIFTT